MKSFKYAKVPYRQGGVLIESTDPGVLDWAVSKIKRTLPTCLVGVQEILPTGETYGFYISRLKGREAAVRFWIFGELGEAGWEPFAKTSWPEGRYGGYTYHLRLPVRK